MSLQEHHDAAPLGAAVAEAGLEADLAAQDDPLAVAPRGYWEQVWRRFKRELVPWHKRWFAGAPVDYWMFGVVSALLFWYAY